MFRKNAGAAGVALALCAAVLVAGAPSKGIETGWLRGGVNASGQPALSWGRGPSTPCATADVRVYRNDVRIAILGRFTTSFTDTNATRGVTYSYRIRTHDSCGNFSSYSNYVKIKAGYGVVA